MTMHKPRRGGAVPFGAVATRYVGSTASDYERVRFGQKWESEHQVMAELLGFVPEGTKVLDIPVGTGRLLPFFKARNLDIHGMDMSLDMIAQAQAKADEAGTEVKLQQGDIRSLPFADGYFDLVVCMRFLNLVDRKGVEVALAELARVSNGKLLVGIRYIAPIGDLRPNWGDLVRLASRGIWTVRRLIRGDAVVVQKKQFVSDLLQRAGLGIVHQRYVERRWDGSDYVLLMLEKQSSGD